MSVCRVPYLELSKSWQAGGKQGMQLVGASELWKPCWTRCTRATWFSTFQQTHLSHLGHGRALAHQETHSCLTCCHMTFLFLFHRQHPKSLVAPPLCRRDCRLSHCCMCHGASHWRSCRGDWPRRRRRGDRRRQTQCQELICITRRGDLRPPTRRGGPCPMAWFWI